jgi:hypothetical protein
MAREPIPEDVRRFIFTRIPSVPFLEALLLLRAAPERTWSHQDLAGRLYVSEKVAGDLLSELREAGVLAPDGADLAQYRFHPGSEDLRQMIDLLADVYAKHLIEVTNLIHSKMEKKAQRFADAFRFRREP